MVTRTLKTAPTARDGEADRWLTPPEAARMLKVDPAKIIRLIRTGELAASNVALHLGGRPRFRVSPGALDEFLRRRQVGPMPKPVRRKRQSAEPSYY
jgi:hypothetical protein